MLTLLVCNGENLEQLLPDSDWLALVTDLLFPLQEMIRQHSAASASRDPVLTSGISRSFGNNWNIFFTQKLILNQLVNILRVQEAGDTQTSFEHTENSRGEVSPKLGGFNGGGLLVNENCPNVRSSFRMYQSFVLLLWRQILNVARHVTINASADCK